MFMETMRSFVLYIVMLLFLWPSYHRPSNDVYFVGFLERQDHPKRRDDMRAFGSRLVKRIFKEDQRGSAWLKGIFFLMVGVPTKNNYCIHVLSLCIKKQYTPPFGGLWFLRKSNRIR